MYNFIGQKVHFIIRTREREGWANVVLQLDPKKLSDVVKGSLREFVNSSEQVASRSPQLFRSRGEAMQRYGHGNGVLLVSPQALKELSISVADFPRNSSNNTVVDEFKTISNGWLPDTYPKHGHSRLQKAIGVFGAGGGQLEFPQTWLRDHLENKLQGGELMQRLSLKELGHYLRDDPRQVFITECTKETGKIAVLVTNGISGANGGLG